MPEYFVLAANRHPRRSPGLLPLPDIFAFGCYFSHCDSVRSLFSFTRGHSERADRQNGLVGLGIDRVRMRIDAVLDVVAWTREKRRPLYPVIFCR
jgi:hypothetical protein